MGHRFEKQETLWEDSGADPSRIWDEHVYLMETDLEYKNDVLEETAETDVSNLFAERIHTIYREQGWQLPKHDDLTSILRRAKRRQELTNEKDILAYIALAIIIIWVVLKVFGVI